MAGLNPIPGAHLRRIQEENAEAFDERGVLRESRRIRVSMLFMDRAAPGSIEALGHVTADREAGRRAVLGDAADSKGALRSAGTPPEAGFLTDREAGRRAVLGARAV